MSAEWSQQKERSTPLALGMMRWIALHMGRGVSRLLLFPITGYFLLTARRASRASRDYLSLALKRDVGVRDVARHLYFFACTLLDRVFFYTGRFDKLDIRVHNPEVLLDYEESGRGCILLGSHLGSFEVMRALGVVYKQLPIKVLMHRDQNPTIVRMLDALNPDIADTVIDTGGVRDTEVIFRVQQAIESGQMVGILGDRVHDGERAVPVEFMGRRAELPAGPLLIASALKAPVVMFFGLYRGGNRYDIYFELLSDEISIPRAQRAAQLGYWTQYYADRLEYYARLAPYNWFNFYDYWKYDAEIQREAA